MKNTIIVPLFLCFAISTAFAQPGNYARFVPAMPRAGDTLRIEYDAGADGAVLKNVGSVTARVQMVGWRRSDTTLVREMRRAGARWSATVEVVPEQAMAYIATFRAKGAEDRNLLRGWTCFILDSAGTTRSGSYQAVAKYYRGIAINGFEVGRNTTEFVSLLERERVAFPEDASSLFSLWSHRWSIDSASAYDRILFEADSIARLRLAAGYAESLLLTWLSRLGRQQLADTLRTFNRIRFPELERTIDSLRVAHGPSLEVMSAGGRLIHSSKVIDEPYNTGGLNPLRIVPMIDSLGIDSVASLVETRAVTEPFILVNVVYGLLRNENQIQRALDLAARGIEAMRRARPGSWLEAIADEQRTYFGGYSEEDLIRAYIDALVAAKRNDEALTFCRMLVDSTRRNSLLLNSTLSRLFYERKQYNDLEQLCLSTLWLNRISDDMITRWRMVAAKRRQPPTVVDDSIAAVFERTRDLRMMRLRAMMRAEPVHPIDVQLPGGTRVPLVSLKGKVVVLAFWSTWCSPVEKALKPLNTLCERLGADERLALFAINSNEVVTENSPPERKELHQALVQRAQSVLTCSVSSYADVEAGRSYKLNAMPCFYIIDAEGVVRFREASYINAHQYTDDLLLKAELCLNLSKK